MKMLRSYRAKIVTKSIRSLPTTNRSKERRLSGTRFLISILILRLRVRASTAMRTSAILRQTRLSVKLMSRWADTACYTAMQSLCSSLAARKNSL
jgi:hypothetical protein